MQTCMRWLQHDDISCHGRILHKRWDEGGSSGKRIISATAGEVRTMFNEMSVESLEGAFT